ncbi:hypothetical protein yc1106_06915 [Curvularia clavata]|uniref:Clr5 domain-containing protein n=1 Tax=Curvularia clavata TaxID=95742 RepID=A0A9Q9DVP4_CURCL|nr:hypothetical protein yc1106_06915 [Curvularia clavata]
MDRLNIFYAPGEQSPWSDTAPFQPTYQHGNDSFTTTGPAQLASVDAFATPASIPRSHRVPEAESRHIPKPSASRTCQKTIVWDQHREELRKLYLEDNMKLDDIQAWMKRERSLDATKKQYKDRFKLWGWKKNLPPETAQFMVDKAKERKQGPDKKDTSFKFGGMTWTSAHAEVTVKRAGEGITETIEMSTPMGVVYETPGHINPTSPENAGTRLDTDHQMDEATTISSGSDPEAWESDSDGTDHLLSLTWRNKTRSDVHDMLQMAKQQMHAGHNQQAEKLLREVLKGYKNLLGSTHEDTSHVFTTLATLCFEMGRLPEAYKIIEESCRLHIEKNGLHDRRTQQHINNVAELLHGWNRGDDALAFLNRVREIGNADRRRTISKSAPRHKKPRAFKNVPENSHGSLLQEAASSIQGNSDPVQLDYGISLVRARGPTEDATAKQLLYLTIESCGSDTNKLAVQRLKAWAELLKLHNDAGQISQGLTDFNKAYSAFYAVLQNFPWDQVTKEKFRSFQLMESALEFVAQYVRARLLTEAKQMFQMCQEKASKYFAEYSERTIWVLISIGLVYQRYRSWNEACPWFEHALSTAMELYDENDGIRMSLEEAMENKHFSYINDEGRPYRTIFGVNGLKIMPTRLHME